MARYFFHTVDGRAILDTVGVELPNIWDVRTEAMRRAGEVLTGLDTGLLFGGLWTMTVADDRGIAVFSLKFEANTYGT